MVNYMGNYMEIICWKKKGRYPCTDIGLFRKLLYYMLMLTLIPVWSLPER